MLKITIEREFETERDASVWLNRVVGADQIRQAIELPAVPAPQGRKPRSDAGQPRGPYKVKSNAEPTADGQANATALTDNALASGETGPSAAAPDSAAQVTEAEVAQKKSSVPSEPVAAEPTLDDVRAAMTVLAKKKNIEANMAILRKFGVQQVSKLPEGKRGEFIAAVLKEAA